MAAIQKAFDKEGLLLSVTIQLTGRFEFNVFNFSKLSKIVEFINVIFDYHRNVNDYGLNDAVKSFEITTDQERIEKLLGSGLPPSKLVLGIHFSGPAFTLTSSGKDEDATYREKTFGYGSICKVLTSQPNSWEKTSGPSGVSIVRKKTGDNKFVLAIENTRTIANKVRLAMKRGLGGIAPIYISSDDVQGQCNAETDTFEDFTAADDVTLRIPQRTAKTFPLLRTVKETIGITLDEITQEAINQGLIPPSETPQATDPHTIDPPAIDSSIIEPLATDPPTDIEEPESPATPEHDKKVVCPVFVIQPNYDFSQCTHVIKLDGSSALEPWDSRDKEVFKQFAKLKKQYPHLKVC